MFILPFVYKHTYDHESLPDQPCLLRSILQHMTYVSLNNNTTQYVVNTHTHTHIFDDPSPESAFKLTEKIHTKYIS